jgi:hypothetical protein
MAQVQEDYRRAHTHYAESARIFWECGPRKAMVAVNLKKLAELANVQGLLKRAAVLLGVASALAESDQDPHFATDMATDIEQAVLAVRVQLGEAAFAALWAEGRTMPLERVMAYALNGTTTTARLPSSG